MEFKIREGEDFIKLGQLLKAADLVSSGVDAKIVILNGEVSVNGEVCLMRGKKIREGDIVGIAGETIEVVSENG